MEPCCPQPRTPGRRPLRIVIPGGSGQVGTVLARAFHADGHDVVVLSRRPAMRPWRVMAWDGKTLGGWAEAVNGCDVVINLAGRSVNCRYHAANRKEMLESRTLSTRVIGDAINQAAHPPCLWLQASTATIYAHRHDAPNDEYSGILGEPTSQKLQKGLSQLMTFRDNSASPDSWRFSIDVALAWERAFDEAACQQTRKIALRSAMTMSPDRGGVFDTLLMLVRLGLGGRAGEGRQFVSWIHEHDFVAAVRWLIEHGDIDGVVNLASPNPVPNEEFMRVLREEWGVRYGLPATKWMLELGAMVLRTETELILKSRRVVPARLLEHGFHFTYPEWRAAARELCGRARRQRLMNPLLQAPDSRQG